MKNSKVSRIIEPLVMVVTVYLTVYLGFEVIGMKRVIGSYAILGIICGLVMQFISMMFKKQNK